MPEQTPQQAAAFRRHYCCRKCSASGIQRVDGSKCGGFPGIEYDYCAGCGHAQPITKKQTRAQLRKEFTSQLREKK